MDNIVFNSGLNIYELLSYFSCELILVFAIILNIILFPFAIKRPKIKRASDLITCTAFFINSIILFIFFFQNEFFSLGGDILVFNRGAMLFKMFVNIFALFFIIATYKFTRKSRFKAPIVNSILAAIILLSGLLLTSDNFAFVYILLEGIIILIYKYASSMHISKTSIYSPVYITISFSATFLFVIFYFMDFLVQDLLQKSIMQSCMIIALLLKIGLFPIFNYAIDKKCKDNIAYTILIFCFLPFIGSVAFNKIYSLCMFNEVCQMCAAAFVIICALSASVCAYKVKNLSGYFIYLAQIFACFYISNSVFTKDMNPTFIFISSFVLLALFSMLRIYKNNSKTAFVFSSFLITSSLLIPLLGINTLYGIYTYDKTGFFALNVFVFCSFLIIIKTLSIIEGFYKTKKL